VNDSECQVITKCRQASSDANRPASLKATRGPVASETLHTDALLVGFQRSFCEIIGARPCSLVPSGWVHHPINCEHSEFS
jgi:hypothetical protein